jgi:hypothetical protein
MFINLCRLTDDYIGGRIKLDSFEDLEDALKTARGYVETSLALGEDIELVIDLHFERKENKKDGSK